MRLLAQKLDKARPACYNSGMSAKDIILKYEREGRINNEDLLIVIRNLQLFIDSANLFGLDIIEKYSLFINDIERQLERFKGYAIARKLDFSSSS